MRRSCQSTQACQAHFFLQIFKYPGLINSFCGYYAVQFVFDIQYCAKVLGTFTKSFIKRRCFKNNFLKCPKISVNVYKKTGWEVVPNILENLPQFFCRIWLFHFLLILQLIMDSPRSTFQQKIGDYLTLLYLMKCKKKIFFGIINVWKPQICYFLLTH